MNRAHLNFVVAVLGIASAVACSGPNATQSVPPITTATAAATTARPSPTTSASATLSPVPSSTATGFTTSSATFTSPSGYNGLTNTIALLDTTEGGGNTNATFMSIPHGQSGTGADTAHPNRKITLEVNDRAPISNSSSYTTPDFSNGKVFVYYFEEFGSGVRGWIGSAGTVTFENVGNGSATYRLRGVTLVPDTYFSPNTATGTFVLDASGTANPYTSN